MQEMAWKRKVLACPACHLRFIDPFQWLPPEAEAVRYRLHKNSINDEGYIRFLQPVVECLRRNLPAGRVLDYGCGPAPVLMELLRRAGYEVSGYDPNFHVLPEGWDLERAGAHDAVVSAEVFEHFRSPRDDISRIAALLKPGGWLVVMTELVPGSMSMDKWAYANDTTHILFFSDVTFQYMAERWGFQVVEISGGRLVLMQRTG